MRVRNSLGSKFSGTIGKDTVAVEGPTTNYLREYVVPHDPKSERQLEQRSRLRQAVEAWQRMSFVQQAFYRHLDSPRIGYHVFLGRAVDALVAGQPIETPAELTWAVEGGPVEKGRLLVRRRGSTLVMAPLNRPTVEVAITPSDGPYALVLTKGFQEEEVLTLPRAAVPGTPPVLESATLGIRLVPKIADATPPAAPS